MKEEATKHDTNYLDKPPMDLLPGKALLEVARVMGFGAQKYEAHNWRKGMNHSRLTAASLRHIVEYISGEDKDPESELEHLAHAACCILMLIESRVEGYGRDDRHVRTK